MGAAAPERKMQNVRPHQAQKRKPAFDKSARQSNKLGRTDESEGTSTAPGGRTVPEDFIMTETAARGPRKAGDVVSTKHYPEAK
jgi:hypothetical protein